MRSVAACSMPPSCAVIRKAADRACATPVTLTTGKGASCGVALSYVPPAASPKAKPANWNDTVLLVNTPQGWKVDDVVYDAGFAFGNTGRLSEMLAMVMASNP